MLAEITEEEQGRPFASFRFPPQHPIEEKAEWEGAAPRKPEDMETPLSGQRAWRGSRRHRGEGAPSAPARASAQAPPPTVRSHW